MSAPGAVASAGKLTVPPPSLTVPPVKVASSGALIVPPPLAVCRVMSPVLVVSTGKSTSPPARAWTWVVLDSVPVSAIEAKLGRDSRLPAPLAWSVAVRTFVGCV